MTVTNLSNITQHALVTGANQVPFTLRVDSQQVPKALVTLRVGTDYLVQNAEMICFRRQAPFYYFNIDLADIINTLFTKVDDELQAEWSWKSMDDWIYDVELIWTVTNGVDADVTDTILFTIVNSATQINNDNQICDVPANCHNIDQYDKLFVGEHNIGYAYVIVPVTEEVSTSQQSRDYFIDSDDYYFTNKDDYYLYEN